MKSKAIGGLDFKVLRYCWASYGEECKYDMKPSLTQKLGIDSEAVNTRIRSDDEFQAYTKYSTKQY